MAMVLAWGSAFAAQSASSPTPTPSDSRTLVATVRAVDAQAGTVEVVTGVGLALRVVTFSFTERTEVRAAGAQVPRGQLKAGNVVRVDYTKDAQRNVAKSVEVQPAPPGAR